jgi:ABC-type amino acid transport system permease subunit
MVKRVLPSVTNEVITLVKDTSLAYAIGVVEMFTRAKQIAVAPNSPGFITLFVAGIFYYVFNFLVAWIMERIEKRLNYYQ